MQSMSFSFICLCFSCASALSPLTPFTFHAKGSPVSLAGDANCEARGASSFKESAPGIALAVNKKQGHCWMGGGYNYRDFTIQPGLAGPYRAYQISAPKTKPHKFAASDNTIWLSFDKPGKYKVYVLTTLLAGKESPNHGGVEEMATITATAANTFVKVPGETKRGVYMGDITVGVLADKFKTVIVAPASTRVSMWPKLGTGVEGAIFYQDSNFKITARRWDLSVGQPFNPAKEYQLGPANFPRIRKFFFPVDNNGKEGVVWQDQTTRKIFLSWLTTDFSKVSHVELSTDKAIIPTPILAAAAGNGKGEVLGRARACIV